MTSTMPTSISIHALLAESDMGRRWQIEQDRRFLSTLSLRRATNVAKYIALGYDISIHALLAESDETYPSGRRSLMISIHALLAESDTLMA